MLMPTQREVSTMQTANVKETAHQLIDQLPDDTSWEKVLYTLQVRHDIEAGLADVEAGRVVTTEQLRRDLGLAP
ncbi:MAG: hypothetical protein P8Y42_18900 [Exilibacterium sp.]